MSDRKVTERDFREPRFRDADPNDYEFRDGDNAIVRKDRWQVGMRSIAGILGMDSRDGWEICDVVHAVRALVKAKEQILSELEISENPDETN